MPTRSRRLRSRLAAAATTLLVGVGGVVGLVGGLATPAHADAGEDLLAMINAERAAAGVGPLRLNSSMSGVAAAWSQSMADVGALSHNPDYATQIPGGWSAAAENVAWNSPADVAGLHRSWMESQGHRENILGGAYTDVGIAVVIQDGQAWGTEVFAAYGSAPMPAPAEPAPAPAEPAPAPATAPSPASASAPAPAQAPAPAPAPDPEPAPPVEPAVTSAPAAAAEPVPGTTPVAGTTASPSQSPAPTARASARDTAEATPAGSVLAQRTTGTAGARVAALGGLLVALAAAAAVWRVRTRRGAPGFTRPPGGGPDPAP